MRPAGVVTERVEARAQNTGLPVTVGQSAQTRRRHRPLEMGVQFDLGKFGRRRLACYRVITSLWVVVWPSATSRTR